ncbi:MAG: hypothetical protein A3J09_02630 [Candidatus Zambryskibacteria bacterium RIFCSPLOWO2_02_FULL_51_21]|uniref:DUF5652 domain-containing protein n=1 Tax=Candidatus Zambryskibacteria bacterium RIFCSPHIGHO2_02_FULL_43_37 TaxID=1802749 RepID=A0A1G2TGB2_9BACT|nr:MAG: hypothetical protein A2723_02620 [Candidatus Zambryskibacteria bacterium RIFCSPHIGHO2_01_FULL_52_18]OHA96320.1 MAG: hypothetical protein A3D49_00270 [Candidatus Zambryskibacteria bacterium RIFCSPHIGHO2_02_FULL_43_37]OHB07723.1 MAG: hypothetical protein A2944_00145 [Candidatus Zambryskibacteria bacterium RIFCSPLOWO2_01_FULL_52_12]OHB11421.1 MAG: hypothetical protein A3J09_02630 [Candidatus Zambryskibacteria bacterium RIFCSPLOWO2_02_FULL_51_21]
MESINTLAALVGIPVWAIVFVIVWTIAWKGLALWRAAGLRQKWWFAALLIINTLGILEIIYLFLVSRNYKVEVVEEK